MLPAGFTTGTLRLAETANSATALLPSSALLFIQTIIGVFVGFFILSFLWKFMKKDQA